MLNKITNFSKGYYKFLLFFFIMLFISRPYFHQGVVYVIIWKVFLTGAFISAVFNVKQNSYVKKIAVIFAILALVSNWCEMCFTNIYLIETTLIFTIIFMGICTVSVVYNVILRAKVTLETLRGVVCAYFMLAFVFAYIYYLIEYLVPGSFLLVEKDIAFGIGSSYLSQLMYFSFVTLLTIGYGDIIPLFGFSQTAVVVEGIIGQFYIAILVSRIVAVYSLSGKFMKPGKNDLKE